MKVIVSHPTANQNVRAVVRGFIEAGVKTSFKTTIATFPGEWLHRLGGHNALGFLRKRAFDAELRPYTRTWPWLEAGRQLALKAGFRMLTRHEHGVLSVDSVYNNFDQHTAAVVANEGVQKVDAVYAYEDGALSSFRAAKKTGLTCLYDLPIGHWRVGHEIFKQEKERWPAWSATLSGLKDSAEKLARKDEELMLADRIYVASKFTADSLSSFPGTLAPVKVIPYGFPPPAKHREKSTNKRGPLKLLFVGSLTQRKGIADLFSVVDSLRAHVQLTVVGKKTTHACVALNEALAKHRWIPALPHEDVLTLMRSHDVLVFPSLFEGFGLVITEAMSQGTPVITTERTAGPDLIEHGNNGWIINAGSTELLKNAIEELLYKRESVMECGRAALDTARRRPWEVYGRELAESVLEDMEQLQPLNK
jgi:glycosyltransferase involved in cell wall biosynthesis